jgi:hypothetical protein
MHVHSGPAPIVWETRPQWHDFELPDNPIHFPSSVFFYALQVLQDRSGIRDIGLPDLKSKLAQAVGSVYERSGAGSFALGIKLDETTNDDECVDDPELVPLIRSNVIPHEMYHQEPLEPGRLAKLFALVRGPRSANRLWSLRPCPACIRSGVPTSIRRGIRNGSSISK